MTWIEWTLHKNALTPCFSAANVTLCNVSSSTNGRTASWSITWNKQIKVNKKTKRNATTDRHWCTDWISFEKQFWIEFLTQRFKLEGFAYHLYKWVWRVIVPGNGCWIDKKRNIPVLDHLSVVLSLLSFLLLFVQVWCFSESMGKSRNLR